MCVCLGRVLLVRVLSSLGGAPLEIHHAPVGVGDQTAMPVLQVDPVELDLVEDFASGLDKWLHIPTPGGLSAKRSSGLPRPDLSLRPVGT